MSASALHCWPAASYTSDRSGRCAFTDAVLRGADVALDAATDPGAVAVRYCWADSPICNFYDREGLPAVPFEMPIGPARIIDPALRKIDPPHERPEAQ